MLPIRVQGGGCGAPLPLWAGRSWDLSSGGPWSRRARGTHLRVHQGDAYPVVMEQHAALGPVEIQLLSREDKDG